MSNTRTLNDLVQLLHKNNIAERDAVTFATECSQFKDPETIDVMYRLVDAHCSNPVLTEDLKKQLGIENSLSDLLAVIPSTVHAIDEQKDPSKPSGEVLVRNVMENLISIITLKPDNKILTDETKTPEEKAKELTAPLVQSVNEVKNALSLGEKIFFGFAVSVFGLGGAVCLAISIAALPFAGPIVLAVGAYGAGMCWGMAGAFLSIYHKHHKSITDSETEAPKVPIDVDVNTAARTSSRKASYDKTNAGVEMARLFSPDQKEASTESSSEKTKKPKSGGLGNN